MIVVGVDENGLGPLLGPLVVTACAFRTPDADPALLWRLKSKALLADDSKAIFKRQRPEKGEIAVLRWLMAFGHEPTSYSELAQAICHDQKEVLPCKGAGHRICTPAEDLELPVWARQTEICNNTVREELRRVAQSQTTPFCLRAVSLCPGAFNVAIARDEMNKFRLDLELMVALVTHIAQMAPDEPVLAFCGKVGGTKSYMPWLSPLGVGAFETLEETPAQSRYRLNGRVEFRFVKDGDAAYLPVAVASMVGKYLRELAMFQINHELNPEARHVSGYRDQLTAEFVSQTHLSRSITGFPDICFLRNS